jgi:hypothetical protein
MHELFGVEFVDGVLDDAPVAQIDPSLGESAAICAPGPQQFSSSKPPRNDAQVGNDSPDGQLDVVGGAVLTRMNCVGG